MMAMKRMSTLAALSPGAEDFGRDLQQYKEESEKVRSLVAWSPNRSHPSPQEAVDENEQVFSYDGSDEDGKKARNSMSPKQPQEVLSAEIAKLTVDAKSKAN